MGVFSDDSGGFQNTNVDQPAANILSVTVSGIYTFPGASGEILFENWKPAAGYVGVLLWLDGNSLQLWTRGDAGDDHADVVATGWFSTAPWCVTAVWDTSIANGARVYINGTQRTMADDDQSGAGDLSSTGGIMTVMNTRSETRYWHGGISRLRVDYGYKATLADHRTLCGNYGLPPGGGSTLVTESDVTYTTSSTQPKRCYQISATDAACAPARAPGWMRASPYAVADTAYTDEPSCVQRVLWAAQADCVRWTCVGATTAESQAPNETITAYSVTATAGQYIEGSVLATAAPQAVDLRLWGKCSTGTVSITNPAAGGAGNWSVDCSTLAGSWALLTPGHPAVTETVAFASGTGGAISLRIGEASIDVWMPTITTETGCYSTVFSAGAAIDTGTRELLVDNTGGQYVRADRGEVQFSGVWTSGGCFEVANDADNLGWSYLDGSHWIMYDADTPSIVSQVNMAISGDQDLVLRWNRAAEVAAGGHRTEGKIGAVQQPWDVDPLSSWPVAHPAVIDLAGNKLGRCSGQLKEIKIYDRPN
jgi:hypothetical protein